MARTKRCKPILRPADDILRKEKLKRAREAEDNPGASNISQPQKKGKNSFKGAKSLSLKFAIATLSDYNQKLGENYELVESGLISGHVIGPGTIYHINFKAKKKDVPEAQVMTFFAELLREDVSNELKFVFVRRFEELPTEPDLQGCLYCLYFGAAIHHPDCLGFRTGRGVVSKCSDADSDTDADSDSDADANADTDGGGK